MCSVGEGQCVVWERSMCSVGEGQCVVWERVHV